MLQRDGPLGRVDRLDYANALGVSQSGLSMPVMQDMFESIFCEMARPQLAMSAPASKVQTSSFFRSQVPGVSLSGIGVFRHAGGVIRRRCGPIFTAFAGRWSYPAAVVLLMLFIGYQAYRLAQVPTLLLGTLTVVDVVVILRIIHEWRLRASQGYPAPR